MPDARGASDHAARVESELTILLYHGVTGSPSEGIENYSGKHMPADRFASQMRTIQRHCAVLSIDEVVDLSRRGRPFPRRAVVVSFDDGFANNCTVAAPILEALRLPAVFYVTSGMVNTDLMFWVDELEDCLNRSTVQTMTVTLDRPCEFVLDGRAQRISALETIKRFCKSAPCHVKDGVLSAVKQATGVVPAVEHADNYRKITWEQLRTMAASPLFTVGGHSLYHDVLSGLPTTRMQQDCRLSLGLLSYQLRMPIPHCSYPEGQAHHYDAQVVDALQEQGVVCCPTAVHGLNPPGTDLFHLRRVMVGYLGCPFPFEHLAER